MSWILLGIAATFLWASANILDKILRTRYLKSSLALTASFGIFGFLFAVLMLLILGIPNIPTTSMITAFAAGVLMTTSLIPYLKAMSLEEASRVIPFFHISPIFTLILANIFLNEMLVSSQYLAFASILIGGILISTRKVGSIFHLSPAVIFMLISSLLVSIIDVLLKFTYSQEIFWHTFLVFYFGMNLSQLSLFLFTNVRTEFAKTYSKHGASFLKLLFLSVSSGSLAHMLFSNAILLGLITILSVMVGFQSFFVLLIATFLSWKFSHIIKEPIDTKTIGIKLVAIGLMVAGLALLAF